MALVPDGYTNSRLGFTGTREGMTLAQKKEVFHLLGVWRPRAVEHGCCVGADVDFHKLVRKVLPLAKVVGRPSLNKLDRSHELSCDLTMGRKGPLQRNRSIVDACDTLLACPKGPEELRSGTWSCVRYARRTWTPVTLVYPDGRVVTEVPADEGSK